MIIHLIYWAFRIYFILLIVRVIGSWIPQLQHTKFMRFIAFYADPYLNLFRKFIPPLGGIDFSPIVAFLVLQVLQRLVLGLLVSI